VELRFSNQDLRKLIVPLVIEQFLQFSAGLISSIMVAGLGEAAVSAVSLVDSVFILFIMMFSALATGGAVVAGQLIGLGDLKKGCQAAWQMILFVGLASVAVMGLCYLGHNFILDIVFGDITPEVRQNAKTFLLITNASIPVIALYNGGAAIFRVMGNSKISMKMSLLMNVINIAGIAILIYGVGMGIEGAGVALLTGRTVAAVVILKLLCNQELPIHISRPLTFRFDFGLLKRIMRIGIPNGLENSMFQLGRLLTLSMISGFGTFQIAANSTAGALTNIIVTITTAIRTALLTVIGQCVGARDEKQIKENFTKGLIFGYVAHGVGALLMIIFRYQALGLYASLEPETVEMAAKLMCIHLIPAIFLYPLAFQIPSCLRAANESSFVMWVTILSMAIFRLTLAWLLCVKLGWGAPGVYYAMVVDWICRSICYAWRWFGGYWKKKCGIA
jgi:putative MATE family efflux protein